MSRLPKHAEASEQLLQLPTVRLRLHGAPGSVGELKQRIDICTYAGPKHYAPENQQGIPEGPGKDYSALYQSLLSGSRIRRPKCRIQELGGAPTQPSWVPKHPSQYYPLRLTLIKL